MGKRKLHGLTYYQCDWTGLPMRDQNCYFPVWKDKGRLHKSGSYLNWGCVKAHANEMFEASELTLAQYSQVCDHADFMNGGSVTEAPPYEHFDWFARRGEGKLDVSIVSYPASPATTPAPPKKKKKAQTTTNVSATLTTEEFNQLRTQMASELASVEHASSSLAQKPEDMARASWCPPPTGQELANLVDPSGEKRERLKKRLKDPLKKEPATWKRVEPEKQSWVQDAFVESLLHPLDPQPLEAAA